MRSLLLLSILAGHALAEGDWEWAGMFSLAADNKYTWSCARGSNGQYAASELHVLIVPAHHADQSGLEEAEEDAEAKWGTGAVEVEANGVIPVNTWAHLEMDQDSWVSTFKFAPSSAGAYAVFTNHPPAEFEKGFHYLKDKQGNDVEPVVQETKEAHDGHDHHDHDDHGDDDHDDHAEMVVEAKAGDYTQVIMGSIIIALPSLALIGVVGPVLHKLDRLPQKKMLYAVMYSFSSGALLGCVVFLLLGEGLHLAAAGKSEVDGVWTWGVAILAGWLLCVLIHQACDVLFPQHASCAEGGLKEEAATSEASIEAGNENKKEGIELTEVKLVDYAVATPVVFGDFWHNLIDGAIVGFSAKTCGGAMTWTIVGVTVLHELPQEIADFVILVTKANMKWYWAAVVNFASGLAALLGAILAYEIDMSVNFQGLGLAFGGGVYMYVAMTELAPMLLSKASPKEYIMRLAAFTVGAAAIGLVLLGHEHCSAGGGGEGGDAHAGHNH